MTLTWLLEDPLKRLDCLLVRAPVPIARVFIQSNIEYALLLFDDTTAGAGLERFTRTLKHREQTPVIIIKKSGDSIRLLNDIRRRLGTN
jgi:hypothetical protein